MSFKESFIEFIGPIESLNGYVKSYKLLLLKSLIETMDSEGKASVTQVARKFKGFYEGRKARGLKPDIEVDAIIQNIETSSISQVISIVKGNPYDAFNRKGYLLSLIHI